MFEKEAITGSLLLPQKYNEELGTRAVLWSEGPVGQADI